MKQNLINYTSRIFLLFSILTIGNLNSLASINTRFQITSANELEVNYKENIYSFTPTGSSACIKTAGLGRSLNPGEKYLCFEYKSPDGINFPGIHFPDENGNLYGQWGLPSLQKTEEWITYSFDISKYIDDYGWGDVSSWLRIAFGAGNVGKSVEIQNIRICSSPDEPWSEENSADLQYFDYVRSLGLPVVYITTLDEEEPICEPIEAPEYCGGWGITNANKAKGRLLIYEPDGSISYDSGEYEKGKSGMTVKVRGNSSAYANKKPYKIKLEKKADLLMRDDKNLNDKNWVIIKDEDGKSQFGFEVSRMIGQEWTPSFRPINLILNNQYRGVYLIGEGVERNVTGRLNVDTSGFIAELDTYYWNEDGCYLMSKDNPGANYTFKYPDFEEMTEDQKDYIQSTLTSFENSCADGTFDLETDVESFAKWLLIHDIIGNLDAAGSNKFFVKYDNTIESKITMGNVWDLGASEKVDGLAPIHGSGVFKQMLESPNNALRIAYIELWDDIKDSFFQNMEQYLRSQLNTPETSAMDHSLEADYKLYFLNGNAQMTNNINRALSWYSNRRASIEPAIEDLREKITVTSVTLNEQSIELSLNQTYKLTAEVLPIAAPNKNVLWASSNPNVALVDDEGVVTGVSTGTAEITASCGEKVASCNVEVKDISNISNIEVDIERSPEYFSVTGVKVPKDNLIPGLYICKYADATKTIIIK